MTADVFRLQRRLTQASQMGVAPALAIGVNYGVEHQSSTWFAGHLDEEGNGICDERTVFDLASLTKPLTTTLWVLRLVQNGQLRLDDPIGQFIDVRSDALSQCPIWRLLTHTAGLPAHQEYFRGLGPHALQRGSFASSCASIRRMVLSSGLKDEPGKNELYSDIGYLCLETVCESVDKPLADAWLNLPYHSRDTLHFRPIDQGVDSKHVAATERCPWRGKTLQGEVHDDNCWTMGGVAGHAGLFGTIDDVMKLGRAWLDAVQRRPHSLGLDQALIDRVVDTNVMHRNGTRVLGWDTPSPGASSAGQHFGRRSIGHLGFTGTSIWIDPDADLVITLLTNRVCPSRDDRRIRALRPELHNLVRAWLGATS